MIQRNIRCLLAAGFFISATPLSVQAQVGQQDSFGEQSQITVFCTSNRDTTGVCIDPVTDDPLDCVATPGEVVPCKRSDGIVYQCQWLSSTQLQIELSCTSEAKTEPAPISTELFEGATSSPESPPLDETSALEDDVSGASTPADASFQEGQESISASEFAETFDPGSVQVEPESDQQGFSSNSPDQPEFSPSDEPVEASEEAEDSSSEAQPFDNPFLQDFFSRPD